ncbi:stalk domain-containing protein [Paenibacillus sedimenti]|uniref:Copper amine oxidase-like N-terminal domain-containing protein n=1 Tax=Paenibacillus sedimenti TaxID=2770274 RepID=A0A926KZ35_9BACL|nr:stalk domain-containing protein [Paenibacillus sedimenti]MBD0384893.1 hypothetical protein [Paenibacillus sedimenti]
MKKFILGLTCGVALTATTAVYAADTIQAYLFPAKFVINGENKIAQGYETLNYDGHAYVPVRFIAESMGSKVAYDDASKTITVDNGFNIIDPNNREINAGHLSIIKEGNHSIISGKLYISYFAWDHKFIGGYQSMTRHNDPNIDVTKTNVTGNLAFWNDKGELIEKVPYEVKNAQLGEEQFINLQTTSQKDLSGYATVTLESHQPTPTRIVDLGTGLEQYVKDAENKVSFGIRDVIKTGEYSIVRAIQYSDKPNEVSEDAPITFTFLDANGNSLGTATTTLGADKPKGMIDFAVFLGKGDFTNYKSITVQVGK